MHFGKAISVVRAARGLSQKELAQLVGRDPSYVSLIERGKRSPSLDLLSNLSKSLKVPFYLLALLASEGEEVSALPPEHRKELGGELLMLLLDAEAEFGTGS
tara:strand:+ start:2305 stop:2610 length:306 start_codon:yes stop_codon:yes gene_type:complete